MTDTKPVTPDTTRFGKIHVARQAARKVRVIEVAEWGDKDGPLLLYAYPLTVNDVIYLEGNFGSPSEQNVMQIIRQCMDEKGDQFFTLLDKPSLMNEPGDIVGDLLVKLNGAASSFTEELKKNKG